MAKDTTCTVSAVIVTHNRAQYLEALIKSLKNGTRCPDEIIVVDNASMDETAELLREWHPDVRHIRNEDNRLVSEAANQGLRSTRSDRAFLIADDNVVDSGCLEELMRVADERPDVGLVGPVQYFFDDPSRVWFRGVHINLGTGRTRFVQGNLRERVAQTDSIPNCFLVTESVLRRGIVLDSVAVPMHHEEADLAARCRREGLKSVVARDAIDYHRVPLPQSRVKLGSTDFNLDNPRRAYFNARARGFLTRRYGKRWQRIVFSYAAMPAMTVVYMLIALLVERKVNVASAFFRGAVAGLCQRVPAFPDNMDAQCAPSVKSL